MVLYQYCYKSSKKGLCHVFGIRTILKTPWMNFISKAGRHNHKSTKDFCPISLTPFGLKILKCVLDIYLKAIIRRTPYSKFQHATTTRQSTEIAFHEVISTIERSSYCKQCTCLPGYRGNILQSYYQSHQGSSN